MVMIAGKTQYDYNKPILNSLSFPFLFSNLIFDMNIRKQFYELPNFEKEKNYIKLNQTRQKKGKLLKVSTNGPYDK